VVTVDVALARGGVSRSLVRWELVVVVVVVVVRRRFI
jgi:hypothetical protein